jgi:ubiquinone/menaquinone biosynthesis C-methylase UbiE
MIPRILEPEVMDTVEEAVDYDAMNHAEVNRRFVGEFLAFVAEQSAKPIHHVLDVGTGTAQIPIELCRHCDTCQIKAIDLSREMLKLGEKNVADGGFTARIRLEHIDAKQLPYDEGAFDAVISNSIIHHIPEPGQVLGEMKRVLQTGGALFVRDLLRPPDAGTLNHLVQTHAGEENAHQRQMFRDSLRAALTLEEIRGLLSRHAMPPHWAAQTSDRHWTIAGRLG